MATAAMRNFDVLAYNCSTTAGSAIVDVNDTRGIIIGMSVKEYDDTDPVNPAYVNGLLQSGATQLYLTSLLVHMSSVLLATPRLNLVSMVLDN